ncbi:hypothetical protein GILI108418_00580 [Gillisia limnaea]|uniref:Uncharacterized protein n=1 Tax=Gillisia limnaea (strain DSM 15749 / LMG 21470 / R-8282) TaxID=865937 RepID=H2BRE7_GILLR|nr:hypothetical protein Gilli_0318 [Gillisia limnaea DSM 15749]
MTNPSSPGTAEKAVPTPKGEVCKKPRDKAQDNFMKKI